MAFVVDLAFDQASLFDLFVVVIKSFEIAGLNGRCRVVVAICLLISFGNDRNHVSSLFDKNWMEFLGFVFDTMIIFERKVNSE